MLAKKLTKTIMKTPRRLLKKKERKLTMISMEEMKERQTQKLLKKIQKLLFPLLKLIKRLTLEAENSPKFLNHDFTKRRILMNTSGCHIYEDEITSEEAFKGEVREKEREFWKHLHDGNDPEHKGLRKSHKSLLEHKANPGYSRDKHLVYSPPST